MKKEEWRKKRGNKMADVFFVRIFWIEKLRVQAKPTHSSTLVGRFCKSEEGGEA